MKFLAAATLAIASLVAATTIPVETRASTVTATFDELKGARLNLVQSSFGANKGLYYKGIGLTEVADSRGPLQAVSPASGYNVLAFGNLDRLDDDYPYITSKFTGSNSTFDLQSFYSGCLLGNIAGNCTIIVAGYKSGVRVAGAKLNYTPPNRLSSAMVKYTMDSTFKGIDSVRLLTDFTDRATHPGLGGATFLDSIVYTLN